MVTVSLRRPAADMLEARRRGADEALLLNAAGAVAEAAVANVFVARRGQQRTPPASDGAFEGITRDTVLRLALGIDLLGADEAFLSGSGVGIVPIRSVDGAVLRGAPGPLTDKLRAAFLPHARSEGVEF